MNTRKITTLALSVALAMILSFVESQIPPLVAIPGIKIGLANIVTVFLLYTLGEIPAMSVSAVRVVLSSLLFSSLVSMAYALAGAVLSFVTMFLLKRFSPLGITGVSVAGAVMHNVGQIAVAMLVLGTAEIAYYLPVLIISGTIAGVGVGLISGLLTKRLTGVINK